MAAAAEEVGLDSIWIGDHLLYRGDGRRERGPWECWTLLSALAAVTKRVHLGPLVACTAFHPPGLIAKMASTIGEVSKGRFVLGLGAGWNETEFRAFGIPFDRRVSRFEEAFTVIRSLLSGERVTHAGRFSQTDDAVLLPSAQYPVPLMIGANGPRMLNIALPHVDAWNTWYDVFGNTAEGFAALNSGTTTAARDAGRDPAQLRRSACVLVRLDESSSERPHDPDAPAISGSLEQIAARLREFGDAGADEVIVVADPIDERSVRALGEVVAAL
jgi:alkanesulfonate monooxygenase SsuD/methylene tetrahydromethanopterin reductase-like flavin-dependent oxidoreductase (luciferase family)